MKKRPPKNFRKKSTQARGAPSPTSKNSTEHDSEDELALADAPQPSFRLSAPIEIDGMAFGGRGVGRFEGKVYFVEDAIEGDIASIDVTHTSDRYNEAKVADIVTPSKHRGPSPCVYSAACGGCQWQGVDYGQQLIWKKHFLANAIKRIGKLGENIPIEILASPKANEYRNRIFVRARITTSGELKLGYFKRGTREFISISKCMIAVPRLNEFIDAVLQVNFKEELGALNIQTEIKFRFEMQDLPYVKGKNAHIIVSVYDADHADFPIKIIVDKFSKLDSVAYAGGQRELPQAEPIAFEHDLGITYHTSAGVFQQINIEHNHKIRRLVKEELETLSAKYPEGVKILDLFCGSGNLSLALADGKNTIEGIEFSRKAIELAKHNVKIAKLANASYTSGDTEKLLWSFAKEGKRFDVIIADPPRDGMFKSIIPLMKLKPEVIIYISCDPTTLSRDLHALCQREYRIASLKALDFFPNTYHIESFAILTRIER